MRESVRVALERERAFLLQAEREAAEGEARLAEELQPYHNGSPYPEVRGMLDVLGNLQQQWRRERERCRARISHLDARTRSERSSRPPSPKHP